MKRPWDSERKYQAGFLKEYEHWTLEVSYRQHTLGCFIIFCQYPYTLMSQLSSEEANELFSIMREVESALQNSPLFAPDHFNYLQLGNTIKRLHLHGVPRYKKARQFADLNWHDRSFTKPPKWSKHDESDVLIKKLSRTIKKLLM